MKTLYWIIVVRPDDDEPTAFYFGTRAEHLHALNAVKNSACNVVAEGRSPLTDASEFARWLTEKL